MITSHIMFGRINHLDIQVTTMQTNASNNLIWEKDDRLVVTANCASLSHEEGDIICTTVTIPQCLERGVFNVSSSDYFEPLPRGLMKYSSPPELLLFKPVPM